MRTLHLTSPMMRGPDVADAQRLLTTNVFGQNYKPGPIDAIFGEQTMRACKRAHYWIGDIQQQPVMGERLTDYLNGTKNLTADQKHRRAKRLGAAKQTPLRAKALADLIAHLGEKEHPENSNRIDFASVWYGAIGPWCAMAVTRVYVDAGSHAFRRGKEYAYVPYIVADGRAGNNGLAITHDPQPGDLACFDWERNGEADHVGLVEKVLGGGLLQTIEGNTSSDDQGDQSNGGEVCRKTRQRIQVQAFVHVGR